MTPACGVGRQKADQEGRAAHQADGDEERALAARAGRRRSPKISAPNGRNAKPTANRPSAAISAGVGSRPEKNALPITGARLPKMKKSYHSNAVPADDATMTRAIDVDAAAPFACTAVAAAVTAALPAPGDSDSAAPRNRRAGRERSQSSRSYACAHARARRFAGEGKSPRLTCDVPSIVTLTAWNRGVFHFFHFVTLECRRPGARCAVEGDRSPANEGDDQGDTGASPARGRSRWRAEWALSGRSPQSRSQAQMTGCRTADLRGPAYGSFRPIADISKG